MFGRRARRDTADQQGQQQQPPEEVQADPLAPARAMGGTVLAQAARVFADPRGLHAETVLTVLGSLAGRAAQIAATRGVETDAPDYRGRVNVVARDPRGTLYAVGDGISLPLFDSPHSVHAIVTAPMVAAGRPAPTPEDIARNGAATMGTDAFEIPRFAPGTSARWMPRDAVGFGLRTFAIPPILLPPEQWYVAYATAAAELLEMNRPHLDIEPLTRVTLDSANIAAKLLITPTEDPLLQRSS